MPSFKNLMAIVALGLLTACASTGAPRCCDMPCCKSGTHTCCKDGTCPLHQGKKQPCKHCEEHSR